jgi:predicted nucleic acid-binding protein
MEKTEDKPMHNWESLSHVKWDCQNNKRQLLEIKTNLVILQPYLRNSLDLGEASVIQTALQESVHLVCIDEMVGRRIARLSGLNLTGSIGILLKAKSMGYPLSVPEAWIECVPVGSG